MERQNVAMEWRFYEGRADRALGLVAELVGLKPDVLVAMGPPAFEAAKKSTSTIPIVAIGGTDPVGAGLVASLARPGGNITGLTIGHSEENGKRLASLSSLLQEPRETSTMPPRRWDCGFNSWRCGAPTTWTGSFKPRYEDAPRRSTCREARCFGFTPNESQTWPSNTGFPALVRHYPRRQGS